MRGELGAYHRCAGYLHHDSFERTARHRLTLRRFKADIGPTTLRTLQPTLTRATPRPPPGANAPRTIPGFIVEQPPIYRGWWDSLKVLFTRVARRSGVPIRFFSFPVRRGVPGRPLAASLILHGSFILFLIYLHQALPLEASVAEEPRTSARIFYAVPVLDSAKQFPRIAPAGPGGRPGNSTQPELPVLGSTARFTNLTAVSKPVRPDNSRQTIWQRNSPPDLRIPTEVKLPMIALGNPDIPKPKIKIEPIDSRPIQIKKTYDTKSAPTESAMNSQAAVVPFADPTLPRPALALPAGEASKPVQRQGGERTPSVAPDVQAKGDTDLLVMSVDPSGPVKNVALPAGNRWGEFSASPAGGQPGSPAGIANTVKSGGGSGVEGAGGDGSVGIGVGKSGGGGDSSLSVPVSITGSNTAPVNADGLSGPLTTEEMIVPVVTSLHIRKNALVVAGGPMGGGGLGVYKALNCGKIYTVFLPMPGSNWSLEYCARGDAVPPPPSASARTVVHLEKPLIPPDATVKFDFLRLPVSQDKKRKFIVLKGVIDDKGDVGDVEIYAGVLPAMDEAARAAFRRWKFMPALRDGKPVAVDILVGILPTLPQSQ
jgi:Gram-negative bacterial TonB protein C-terminal